MNATPSQTMIKHRAVFVGTARNCGVHLPNVLRNLEMLGALYGESSFVFVVNDCVDDTQSLLEAWLSYGRQGTVIDLGMLLETIPQRTARIAAARNAGMGRVRAGYDSFDHLVVVDLDDVLSSPIAADRFAEAAHWLEEEPSRGGVLANSAPRYYDIWALRHDTWCPHDCWHAIWGRQKSETFEVAKMREVYARQIVLPETLPPLPVQSAFGGLGIYKMKYAIGAFYNGFDDAGRERAEHVAFNEEIRKKGGELFIFPALIVRAPSQHLFGAGDVGPLSMLRLLCHRLREWWHPPWQRLFAPPSGMAASRESTHY